MATLAEPATDIASIDQRRRQTTGRATDRTTARLMAWYDGNARQLPWRVGPIGKGGHVRPDPYRVWLSEIMLQQTRVATVIPYYQRFLARWADIGQLAAAEETEVMSAWAGLGYYSRARSLKRCAETIVGEHGGKFPATSEGLQSLPGIGPYTAAAIAAIAFGEPVAAIDGNVERVIARRFGLATPLPRAKAEFRNLTQTLVDRRRPGDFVQAMMDLGATICTPKSPDCAKCPWQDECVAFAQGDPARLPRRAAKPQRPSRTGAAFVAVTGQSVLLRRRPAKGMLAGMAEPPTTAWSVSCDGATGAEAAPFAGAWRHCGTVRHVFTHFALDLDVWRCDLPARRQADGWWSDIDALDGEALPSLMRKAIVLALANPNGYAQPPKIRKRANA